MSTSRMMGVQALAPVEPPAGYGRRLAAYVLDGLAATVLGGVLIGISLAPVLSDYLAVLDAAGAGDPDFALQTLDAMVRDSLTGTTVVLVSIGYALLFAFAIFQWWFEGRRGYTVGKLALGIRTVDAVSGKPAGMWRVFLRRLVFALSGIVPVLGTLLMGLSPLFDGSKRNRGWHDKAAGTIVVDAKRAATSSGAAGAGRVDALRDRAGSYVTSSFGPPPPPSSSTPPAYGGSPVPPAPTYGSAPRPTSPPPAPSAPSASGPYGAPPVQSAPSAPSAPPPPAYGGPPAPPASPAPAPPPPPAPYGASPAAATGSAPAAPPPPPAPGFPAAPPPPSAPVAQAAPPAPAPLSPAAPLGPPSPAYGGPDAAAPPSPAYGGPAAAAPPPPAQASTAAAAAPPAAPPPAPESPDVAPTPPRPTAASAPPVTPAASSAPQVSGSGLITGAPGFRPGLAPAEVDDLELTRLVVDRADRRAVDDIDAQIPPSATLRLSDGKEVTLTGTVLVGRNPSAGSDEQVDELIRVSDPGRSVSKTHLLVGVDAEGVWVVDRASTNGTFVTLADGQQIICAAHQVVRLPEGACVAFGDYSINFDYRNN